MAGEKPGLVAAPVKRQARFIDLTSFEHEPSDGFTVVRSFRLGLGGFVVVAAIAQLVVLELEEQSGVTGEPVGLMVGDLDRFKDVNDSLGHAAGDVVLKEVAYLLRKRLRAFDLAYRIGGEEFLVLLPGASVEESQVMAEQLREATEEDRLGHAPDLTISFGVSGSTRGTTFDYQDAFRAADAALYEAKAAGRNRVCIQSVSTAPEGTPAESAVAIAAG